jgi:hypothetical protein
MTAIETLQKQLADHLGLAPDAVEFLLDVWRLIQVFDDVADGDDVSRADLDAAIWAALVGLPDNPFFAKHRSTLTPIMAASIIKWQASDEAERGGWADARSYMWRAGYYDLVSVVALLSVGQDAAKSALYLYGETLESYREEFPHA